MGKRIISLGRMGPRRIIDPHTWYRWPKDDMDAGVFTKYHRFHPGAELGGRGERVTLCGVRVWVAIGDESVFNPNGYMESDNPHPSERCKRCERKAV